MQIESHPDEIASSPAAFLAMTAGILDASHFWFGTLAFLASGGGRDGADDLGLSGKRAILTGDGVPDEGIGNRRAAVEVTKPKMQ